MIESVLNTLTMLILSYSTQNVRQSDRNVNYTAVFSLRCSPQFTSNYINAIENQHLQHIIHKILFFAALTGSHPGKQQDRRHPHQGFCSSGQPSEALPVQEHPEGHSQQHAQERPGAAHP